MSREPPELSPPEVVGLFRECGALLEGHFILSSGLRAPVFLQKAKVFQYAHQTEKLCKALAERIRSEFPGVTKVVSPAIGGIIPGYETSRHLGVPALYTERVEGQFELRRGFEIAADDQVVVVEDIVSTGLSIRECVDALRKIGANVVASAEVKSGSVAQMNRPPSGRVHSASGGRHSFSELSITSRRRR